jgi:hypothetical protein
MTRDDCPADRQRTGAGRKVDRRFLFGNACSSSSSTSSVAGSMSFFVPFMPRR